MDINRYTHCGDGIEEHAQGEFVQYHDHKAKVESLEARNRELEARIADLTIERDTFRHGHRIASDNCVRLSERIAEQDREIQHWKANHDNMVTKAAFLSQRPDLPVDRIPAWHKLVAAEARIDELTATNERLNAELGKVFAQAVEWRELAELTQGEPVGWVNKRAESNIEWNSKFDLPNSTPLYTRPAAQAANTEERND